MPYGTIIFIALILVVACSLLYWLSALCAEPCRSSGSPDARVRTQDTSPECSCGRRLQDHPPPKPGRSGLCLGSGRGTVACL